jgi:transcription antitermination factor NusG
MNPCVYAYARKAGANSVLEAKPLLPGYFCGLFDPSNLWRVCQAKFDDGSPVLGAGLSHDGHIRPLSLDTWTQILDLNSYTAEAPQVEMASGLRVGQTVILKNGPHAGARFRLERTTKSGSRAKIIMNILGALREVEITAEQVDVVAA